MMKTTLLPLSLKEPRNRLADMAGYITHFDTEKIYLCHVLEGNNTNERHNRIESALGDIAEIFRDKGMSTETIIRHGNIADEISALAQELNVDYISIKWKKKNVLRRSILGSPDADILRMSDFPAFIYKYRSYLNSITQLKRVVYATDTKETDINILPYLTSVPTGADSLHLLHVRTRAPDPKTDKQRLQEVEAKLQRLADQCKDSYKKVGITITVGGIRSQIARNAKKLNADLIVIGKKDKKKPMEKLVGSTAESIPYRSHCPVLIIP